MTNLPKITTSNLAEWIDRHFVDFDRVFDGYSRATTNYPPHNIVKRSETSSDIELAVAGFSPDDIDITVEGSHLTISAEMSDKTEEDEKTYTYRGISTRSFSKSFYLPEHWEVKDAKFRDGLLVVSLEHYVPEENLPRKIEIKSS